MSAPLPITADEYAAVIRLLGRAAIGDGDAIQLTRQLIRGPGTPAAARAELLDACSRLVRVAFECRDAGAEDESIIMALTVNGDRTYGELLEALKNGTGVSSIPLDTLRHPLEEEGDQP